jgi:DMSO/TMAO reductase YedYZ molybdopterin-dependent catalytic subunit
VTVIDERDGEQSLRLDARRRWATLIGLLCGAVALGVGELVAGFVRPAAAPAIAVGSRLVVLTPESAKRWAIRNLGTSDKQTLVAGVYLALILCCALIGNLAARRLWYGLVGIAVLSAFGVYCAWTAPGHHVADAWPSILGPLAGAATLGFLMRAVEQDAAASGPDRRRFLAGAVGAVTFAGLAALVGRGVLGKRFNASAARAQVVLPVPSEPAPALPPGTDLDLSGTPWATPSSRFYRIDTALVTPQLNPRTWSMRIHGMVEKELTLTWDDLLRRPLIERWITLCCVSNPVGGGYISNARFLGVRLADVLREAGVHDASDQLLMTSSDDMTIGAPTKVVMDGRDALIAIGMNGEPLPVEHGFPVRIVVPGLYGYVSACKWVVDIEATTFAAREAYWVQGGWAAQTDIKLESRIDTPRSGASVTAGRPVPIAGVAWDQHVGVSGVQVQVDDGPWLPATLATVPSTDTWRQWVVHWTPPKPGSYVVRVRATDDSGQVQTDVSRDVFPAGATGWHTIVVKAR